MSSLCYILYYIYDKTGKIFMDIAVIIPDMVKKVVTIQALGYKNK